VPSPRPGQASPSLESTTTIESAAVADVHESIGRPHGGTGQSRAWHTDGVAASLHHIVVDAHDLPALARFWAQVLDWRILSEREREVVIGADEAASVGICFMPVTEVKAVKNRLHLDLNPGPDDRDAEIERILALGARRVNIGQTGAESWTVLADPEGNEFCVLRPKQSLID